MNNALVTGGAGFIGSHLVERLLQMGWNVRVLDNFSSGTLDNLPVHRNLDVAYGSVVDPDACASACRDIDVVFHLAGIVSVTGSIADPIRSNDTNLLGTLRILTAARDAGVRRVVFSSSASVYGDVPCIPVREDEPLSPQSPYASQKTCGEYYCRNFSVLYGLETIILRYFNVFGERQSAYTGYAAVIPLFIDAAVNDGAATIYGDGRQTRDFVHVDSVVSANIRAIHDGVPGQAYNVASGRGTAILDLLGMVEALSGTRIRRIAAPYRPGEVLHSRASVAKARAELSWCADVSLEDGLRRIIGGSKPASRRVSMALQAA